MGAEETEAVLALEGLERTRDLEQLDPALDVGLAGRGKDAEVGGALRRARRAHRAAEQRRQPRASERPAEVECGAMDSSGDVVRQRRDGGRLVDGARQRRADVAHPAVFRQRFPKVLGHLPVTAALRLGEVHEPVGAGERLPLVASEERVDSRSRVAGGSGTSICIARPASKPRRTSPTCSSMPTSTRGSGSPPSSSGATSERPRSRA